MRQLFTSRAGRQLLALLAMALAVWCMGVIFHEPIFHKLRSFSGFGTHILLVTLLVGGFASFVYSMLRILDLRNEMNQRREAENRADWIATHDQLTALPNRYAFDRLDVDSFLGSQDMNGVEIAPPTVTVFSVDLDGFKKVNDLLGHHGGDALLCEVAKRLRQFASTPNVFRFGGDEFIVIADNISDVKAEKFAHLLISLITHPIQIADLTVQVGASVGYASWPRDGDTLEAVTNKSDVALYEAKANGPNKAYRFEHDMQQRVTMRAQFEGKLRRAIGKQQIVPHYQPLVDLSSGQVCGFEALARWTDEDGSFISPQEFITLAEEIGLITDLFQQLLTTACRDAIEWPEHLTLSFNVSPVQMEDRMLASRILDILDETGFAPARLEIEITENALMFDPELAHSVIDKLHEAGIQVALDDFGTGYSSLSQLAHFPFDKLKIDKSFVAESGTDSKQAKIVEAVLTLSKNLNLKSTVEGIEQHTQLAYFTQKGCNIGQGYLFGKAMPASEVGPFLAERSRILERSSA